MPDDDAPKANFVFRADDWIIGYWFVCCEGVQADFATAAWRQPKGSKLVTFAGRMRHYDPTDPGANPFLGKDRFTVLPIRRLEMTDDEAFDSMTATIDPVATAYAFIGSLKTGKLVTAEVSVLRIDGSPDRLVEALRAMPWAHKMETGPQVH